MDKDREKALEILAAIGDLLRERGGTHGEIRENMAALADLQNAYLNAVHLKRGNQTEVDATIGMSLSKLARYAVGDRSHHDHLRDAAAYLVLAACLSEGSP